MNYKLFPRKAPRLFHMYKQFVLGAGGIYFAYLLMSLVAEGVYNSSYPSLEMGQDGNPKMDKFTYPGLAVWMGALLCGLFGLLKGKIEKEKPNPISLKEQTVLGVLYTANIMTTNFALLYISYPVQVIGRNCRLLFVVLIGAFFSRVKHTAKHLKLSKHKILIALVITIGVIMFNLTGGHKDKADKHDQSKEWIGYILLTVSILCDAMFSDSQAYAKAQFKPTANHLFTSANLFTFGFSLIYSIWDGSLIPSIQFCINHPSIIPQLILIGVLQVVGQVCIYSVVANFKQHVFPLISTTRKIFTVLLSIFWYGHTLTNWQWISIVIVFVGMGYELYEEGKHQAKADQNKEKHKLKMADESSNNLSNNLSNVSTQANGETNQAKSSDEDSEGRLSPKQNKSKAL